MKMLRLCAVVCVALTTASVAALPKAKFLYSGDWVYDALATLSQEQGVVFLADSTITVGQAENFLNELEVDALSVSGRLLYERVQAYLASTPLYAFGSDAISASVDVIAETELFFKTNADVPWIYDGHARKPLLSFPLTLSIGPITAGLDPEAAEDENAMLTHANYSNVPTKMTSQFDLHFPKHAYLSLNVPVGEASGIRFVIGTGEDFFGRTRTGSIILSDYMNRVAHVRLSLYSPRLKYEADVMQLEVNKYLYMHYVIVRPHRRVSLALVEGLMVNAPLELRYLDPTIIFHNLEAGKTYDRYDEELGGSASFEGAPGGVTRAGSFFGVKLEYLPWDFIRLYGLFALNQWQLPNEHKYWEESLAPNALAFQAGTEVSIPFQRGYWKLGLEGVYTYPYMYLKFDKGWSFYKETAQVDNMTLRQWTGSPFGPDTIAGVFWAGYEAAALWSATLSFAFAAQGELSDTSIFDEADPDYDNGVFAKYRTAHAVAHLTKPPTGIPTYTSTLSVRGTFAPYSWLTLGMQPGYRFVRNDDHISGKKEHSFELALSARFAPAAR
jgi:hypothetical protein